MQIVITEEFLVLFITHPIVNQKEPVPIFDKKTAQCPAAHIIRVGWISAVPDTFGYHTEHGTAVEFEVAGICGIQFHRDRNKKPATTDIAAGFNIILLMLNHELPHGFLTI